MVETYANASTQARAREAPRWLALGTIAGGTFFTLGSFLLAPLHSGYSSVSEQVSTLAVGPNGGYMRAAFLINGVLSAVGVIAIFRGLRHELGPVSRWTCTLLLLLTPLGVLWAGIFAKDHLALHTLGTVVALGSL